MPRAIVDGEAVNHDRWDRAGLAGEGDQLDDAEVVGEPQRAAAVPYGRVDLTDRQTVCWAIPEDSFAGSIDPVNAAPGPGIDRAATVLDHCADIIAGKPVGDGQTADVRAIGKWRDGTQEAASRRRAPKGPVRADEQVAHGPDFSQLGLGKTIDRPSTQASEPAFIVESYPDGAGTILGERGHEISTEVGQT